MSVVAADAMPVPIGDSTRKDVASPAPRIGRRNRALGPVDRRLGFARSMVGFATRYEPWTDVSIGAEWIGCVHNQQRQNASVGS